MPIDDIWKTFHKSLGIYWKGQFDLVPQSNGVYAWFYPLRVHSYDLEEFLKDIQSVHLYDPKQGKEPTATGEHRFGWSRLHWQAELKDPNINLKQTVERTWKDISENEASFDKLRRTLLQASLLMPPLYVGKTIDLRTRCAQHTSGGSDFAKRYERRAIELNLQSPRVRDLLFVTVRTSEIHTSDVPTEELIEDILKLVSRPPYGVC